MLVFDKKEALVAHLSAIRTHNATVGFVPTMGALHEGHLSLLRNALENNTVAVVSIFVNPTQFNNPEDLKKYPRTLPSDIEKIKTVSDNCIVYAPSVEDIYEGNTQATSYSFDGLENQMEGKFRPGHFDGVGTVVKKLFEIVQPQNAYFGEKDFQQLQIVKKLVAKNQIPVTIIGCPIAREHNQLAMSSRNERLSVQEREKASIIYQTLLEAKEKFGKEDLETIYQSVQQTFENNPIFNLEYFTIADEETLLPCLKKEKNKNYRAFIAVFVNNIRLIDTISLN